MPLITITSGIGCGEDTVARILGKKLDLAVFDDQKLQDEALEMGISSEDIEDFDEKAPNLFSRLLTFKPQSYLELMAVRGLGVKSCFVNCNRFFSLNFSLAGTAFSLLTQIMIHYLLVNYLDRQFRLPL